MKDSALPPVQDMLKKLQVCQLWVSGFVTDQRPPCENGSTSFQHNIALFPHHDFFPAEMKSTPDDPPLSE
jgi:hypothetical protein